MNNLNRSSENAVLTQWDLLSLLGAIGLGLLLFILWPQLPDPVPTHFNAVGIPNGWTPKAVVPWIAFGMPAFIWLFVLALGRIAKPSDKIHAALHAHSMAMFRGLFGFALFLLMSLFVLIPILGVWVFKPILGGFFGVIALAVWLMVRRMNRDTPEEIKRHWKWGMFYANAEDERLWVPKYIGVGWTLNFAKPMAFIFMGGILAVVGTLLCTGFLVGR